MLGLRIVESFRRVPIVQIVALKNYEKMILTPTHTFPTALIFPFNALIVLLILQTMTLWSCTKKLNIINLVNQSLETVSKLG